ncbi:unnamed protein product [Paramecium sonneborni]|uniref:Uncharacterized protein n=1 Tax=Paramecium sonneborni TaxID=65129 RepID=A0A8S1L312_9CILI|nr:unnamed protein product [Paramecium sonneborni]
MSRQYQNELSKSVNQDYILDQYKDSFRYQTIEPSEKYSKRHKISPIIRKQVQQTRQIPINLDVYLDSLTTAKSLMNQKVPTNVYQTLKNNSDEQKQMGIMDQFYSYRKQNIQRSIIKPSTIFRNKLPQENFEQNTENLLFSSSKQNQRIKSVPFKIYYQTQNDRIKQKTCKKEKILFVNKFRSITKVIGRFLLLYFRFALRICFDFQTQRAKIHNFNNLKKAFKIERKFNDQYFEKIQQWSTAAFKKIVFYMQKNYENKKNDELIDDNKILDQNQLWCLNYAKFLFQNIELITREGNIPKEIVQEVSKATLITKQTYKPLFLAKRIKFQNSPLSKSEYQLIASEFIFFNIIIKQLFDQANQLKYQSLKHNLDYKIKVIELASIIHSYFIKYFINMPQREDVRDQLIYQRKLYISSDKNQNLILIDTKDINQSENIVIGLKSEEYVKSLLKNNDICSKKLGKLFDKTIQNIYSQIEICDILE